MSRKGQKKGKQKQQKKSGNRAAGHAPKSTPKSAPKNAPNVAPKSDAADLAGSSTSPAGLIAGIVLLGIAITGSLMLVLEHLGGLNLPGCGPESGCAKLAKSVWGHAPGMPWLTTADIGVAWFLGIMVAWVMTKGRPPGVLQWLVRLGLVGSLVLITVMIVTGTFCKYCAAIHAANILFVVLTEVGLRRGATSRADGAGPLVAFAGLVVIALGVLGGLGLKHEAKLRADAEAAATASITQIIDQGTPQSDFNGRFLHGSEDAPIRIVIFSDYQCPDCKRIETELREILANRTDVSFSAKHFPFCVDCNDFAAARNYNPHPNACWAARAAEAAGILGGRDAFYKMHEWLFDHDGSFTDANFPPALRAMGFEPTEFLALMQGEKTLQLVRGDIAEAIALGIHFTPMIYVNGVEFKGFQVPNALEYAIDRIVAANPDKDTLPVNALEKYLADWRERPVRQIPPDAVVRSLGDGPAEIVVWGDYQEPFTAELDVRLRAAVAATPGVRYTFRHYPFDESCNPNATRTLHPMACQASKAAEAAGRLGGNEAYWKMHAWLMENQKTFSDATLRQAATNMGLDPDALVLQMQTTDVSAAIQDDTAAGKKMYLRSIPFFFVNGKEVPRWRLKGGRVPELIIEEAAAAGAP